ncbi:hypothetical protein FRB98_007662 [Tulasnella sp. 332]|nr:hypothetical protein FRB98_007662 [Tulasnella sp. 332]
MLSGLLSTLILADAALSAPSLRQRAPTFSGITAFGDSYTDNGQAPGSPWELSNHTFPADPNYYNSTVRRWSNGKVLGGESGWSASRPSQRLCHQRATSDNAIIQGVLGDANVTIKVSGAVQQFQKWQANNPAGTDIPKELFVILVGGNEGIISASSNMSVEAIPAVASEGQGAIKSIVGNLTAVGAKNILLGTYLDLTKASINTEEAPPVPSFPAAFEAYTEALRKETIVYYDTLKAECVQTGVHITLGDFYAL